MAAPIRAMQIGPFRAEQHGSDVIRGLDPDHPDFAAFQSALRADVERSPARIEELRGTIAEAAAVHHAFDVIYAAWMSTGLVRPGTLQSYHPEASTSTASYVAHVLLERNSPEPTRQAERVDLRRGVNVELLADSVTEILQRLPALFALDQGADSQIFDPYLDLRTKLYAHHLNLGSLAFEWQEEETLGRLFDRFAEQLRSTIGFTAAEALRLGVSLGHLQVQRMDELVEVARAGMAEMKRQVARERAGKLPDADEPIRRLARLSPKSVDRDLRGAAAAFVAAHSGRAAAFSAADLAAHAEVEIPVAQAFLDVFSRDFGQERDDSLRFGLELEAMRRRPIVHDGNGAYLPAAVDSVLYGLRDVLTGALKGGPAWERFNKHRGGDLEQRALAALATALDADWHHPGVKYWYRGPDGKLAEGEVDGILRADTLIILLEAKAGSMSAKARGAAPRQLERSLRDLIVDAHEQLRRAETVLVRGEPERVTDEHGALLSLDLDGVTRVLRVAVSLDDLSAVAPAVWQLGDAGLLPSEELTPWTVGVHELELICSLIEWPAQLVHYILRRLRTYRQRVWGMDEMDFFMRYLSHGLFWEDEELVDRAVEIHSHTNALDAWAYGERGLRPKRKRPRQKFDRRTRALLDAMADTGASGRLEAQVMLLELSTEAQKSLVQTLRRSVERARRDGEVHRSTFVFGEDMVITVAGVPFGPRREHLDALTEGGSKALEEYNARRWLGLTGTVGSSRPLTGMQVLGQLDRLAEV